MTQTPPPTDPTSSRQSSPVRRGAVAVIVRQDRFLVIRRSRFVAAPRAICFPGGGIEPGESETAALCRELREELNVGVVPLHRVWQCTTAWHVHLAWWQAELEAGELSPRPVEVEAVHWYTAAELLALPDLLESNQRFLQALARGEIELR